MTFSDLPSLAEASSETNEHSRTSRRRETGAHPASSAGQPFRDHALVIAHAGKRPEARKTPSAVSPDSISLDPQ